MSASKNFRMSDSLARIGALTGRGLERDKFVHDVLEEMLRMGFERARFWEVAHDAPRNTDIVVLTAKAPVDATGASPGYCADWADSDVARRDASVSPENEHFPVVVEAHETNDDLSVLARDLDLAGRVRVEIPVTAGRETESILACDWRGSPSDLTMDDRHALRLVGSLIGSHLALEPDADMKRARDHRVEQPDLPASDLVLRAARELGKTIDAAITAVFAFSWTHQEVRKIDQFIARPFQAAAKRQGELAERYPAGGPALTGAAWRDHAVRHTVLFRSLREQDSASIDQASFDWHTETLGEIRSVLYAVVGTLERRYLLRFMNRASHPELPFLREVSVLNAAIGDLRAQIDAAVASERLASLQNISALTAKTVDPVELLDAIGASLQAEGIDDMVVLCHQRDAAQFSFGYSLGPRWSGLRFPLHRRWKHDSLYSATVDGSLSVVLLSEHQDPGRSPVASLLHGVKSVLAQPMQAGQTHGILFIALDATPRRAKGRVRQLPEDIGHGTPAFLDAYARLIANAVESKYAQERVRGARRAYGLMGHELRRPATALGSAGQKAIVESLRALDAVPDVHDREALKNTVETFHGNLRAAQRRVDSVLQQARLVSRESEGSLRLRFAHVDLGQILRAAVDDADLQLREDTLRWRYYFSLNDSAKRLGPAVADEDHLEQVFKNILLNAAKYSLPRRPPRQGERRVVRIDVIGEPQLGWLGIKIRNWGWPIPEDKRDVIFEPWVRGSVEEDIEAISGMGLGLFLARRLVTAHGGEVLCFSEPTNDHYPVGASGGEPVAPGGPRPKRRFVDIYETTFEIRIPRNLQPGVSTYRWRETRDEAATEGHTS